MEHVLDKCLTPTTDMIIQLIEIENAHINTNHPDFIGSADTLLNIFSADKQEQEERPPKSLMTRSEPGSKTSGPKKPHEVEEEKASEKPGFWGILSYGKGAKPELAKSSIVEEPIQPPKQQARRDEFEILQRFGADQQLDKSNLPAVVLPSIPSKMRADTENSRIVMETVII